MYPFQMLNAHLKQFTECNFWTEMSSWYLFKNVTLLTEMFTNFFQTWVKWGWVRGWLSEKRCR